MPQFVFTADSGADTLTITGHGQVSGAGPALVRALAGGTLAGGLITLTQYWLSVVDANTVKLATSQANAIAGTPVVNITSAGTSPQVLEIGVPYRRPRTAAPGVQIFSADDNAVWDALAAIHLLFTGQSQSHWTEFDPRTIPIPVFEPQITGAGVTVVFGGANNYQIPFPTQPGMRVKAIRARIRDSATGPTTVRFRLVTSTDGGAFSTLVTSNTSAGSAAAQTLTATGPVDIAAGAPYSLFFDQPAGSANCNLYWAEADVVTLAT